MKQITEEEYNNLKSHSQMLGIIGTCVEEFCGEDDTTLIGVLRLLGEYYSMKSTDTYDKIEDIKKYEEKSRINN